MVDDDLSGLCLRLTRKLALTGCSVTLGAVGSRTTAAVSAEGRDESDLVELALGEGPGVDALTGGRPVLVPHIASMMSRWPQFSAAALAAGVSSVYAVPLECDGVRVGVMTSYARQVRRLGQTELAALLTFGELASQLVGDLADDPGDS